MRATAITDPNEQRALLRLLHDLGVVVAHGLGQEAPAVKREINLLDPNWLTGAIYKILNEPELRDQDGEFARAQMNDWLDPTLYPPERHEFILTMMEDPAIGLCFELPGSEGRHLIPEALPPSAPYYENWPENSLHFRFRYDFLPRRLIPSFIVRAHGNLAQPPTRWRTGVVLEAAQCPILVRGYPERGRIDIAVDGTERLRRSALNIVLNHLDDIHARNLEIGPQARVPLSDQPDLDVSYEHLLKLEERHGPDHAFDPEGADRSYTVRELLDGVRRDQTRNDETGSRRPGHRFDVGDNAQITIVNGGFRTDSGSIEIGRRVTHTGSGTPDIAEPSIPAELSKGSGLSALSSWRYFSVACGASAVLFAIIMMLLPSNEWRTIVGWPIALGVVVTVLMMSRNPVFFYRRMLSYVIAGGLFLTTAGFSVDIFAQGDPGTGWFRLGGAVSGSFFVAWAVIVVALVLADLKQSR